MLTLKNEVSEDSDLLLTTSETSQELNRWRRTVFTFDMDRDNQSNPPNRNTRNRNTQRSRSASTAPNTSVTANQNADAALSAQLAALAALAGQIDNPHSGMPSQATYPSMGPSPGFYNNFLHHNPWPEQHNQPPSLPPPLDFPWAPSDPSPFQHLQAGPSHYTGPQASSSSSIPFMGMSFPFPNPLQATDMGQNASTPQATTPGSTANSSEVDQSLTEEKRRRNTAASARFRIKKKHKTITLERSVSDLTGRAEELEREVADLRRENGWLKEIVMLKGAQFAVGRSQYQQQQTTLNTETQASSSRETTKEVDSSEQDSDTESQPAKKDKGKAPDRGEGRK